MHNYSGGKELKCQQRVKCSKCIVFSQFSFRKIRQCYSQQLETIGINMNIQAGNLKFDLNWILFRHVLVKNGSICSFSGFTIFI